MKIQADTTRQASSETAYAQCRARQGVEEISDDVAVAIAAWWQSSGWGGDAFAALAGGMPVDYDDFLRNFTVAYGETTSADDRLALDMLGTWALSKLDGE